MRKITNASGNPEWIINEDEKELIDIAIHNLAVSAKIHKGGNHE